MSEHCGPETIKCNATNTVTNAKKSNFPVNAVCLIARSCPKYRGVQGRREDARTRVATLSAGCYWASRPPCCSAAQALSSWRSIRSYLG